MSNRNPNPFKLEDHYDESFLLEDDDDDDQNSIDSLEEDSRTQNKRIARPPSARHGSRSAHSTNSNRDAGYYGSYDTHNQNISSRPVSGKFKDPTPPAGPRREKSGNIHRERDRAHDPAPDRGRNHLNHSDNSSENSEENSGSDLESTDEEFQYQAGEINSRPSGPEPPSGQRGGRHSPGLQSETDSESLDGLEKEGNYRHGKGEDEGSVGLGVEESCSWRAVTQECAIVSFVFFEPLFYTPNQPTQPQTTTPKTSPPSPSTKKSKTSSNTSPASNPKNSLYPPN